MFNFLNLRINTDKARVLFSVSIYGLLRYSIRFIYNIHVKSIIIVKSKVINKCNVSFISVILLVFLKGVFLFDVKSLVLDLTS